VPAEIRENEMKKAGGNLKKNGNTSPIIIYRTQGDTETWGERN